jgi:hypothetical protein
MFGVSMDATFHGGSNDTIGGRRYRRFIPFNFLLSLAAPHLHGFLVLVTGNTFITGVVVTGDNCSPVSLVTGVNDIGDKFIAGNNNNGDH